MNSLIILRSFFFGFIFFSLSLYAAPDTQPVLQPRESEKLESPVAKKIVSKKIKDMTLAEVTDAQSEYEKKEYFELSLQALERMRSLSTDDKELKRLLFKIAQSCMKLKKYDQAHTSFKEFVALYPGSSEAEDAFYNLILALKHQMPDAYNDQALTEELVATCLKFFEKYGKEGQWALDIQSFLELGYTRLLEHEAYICEQYLQKDVWSYKKTHLVAAKKRISYIKEKIAPHSAKAQETIAGLETKLALLEKKANPVVQAGITSKQKKWLLF